MNERIKELVKQAGGHFSTHNLMSNPVQHRESIELWDKNIEKFAELIVRECADACYKHKDVESFGIYPVRVAMVTKACSDNIKEHFGVEL